MILQNTSNCYGFEGMDETPRVFHDFVIFIRKEATVFWANKKIKGGLTPPEPPWSFCFLSFRGKATRWVSFAPKIFFSFREKNTKSWKTRVFLIHALKTIAITSVLEHHRHETLLKIGDRSGTPDEKSGARVRWWWWSLFSLSYCRWPKLRNAPASPPTPHAPRPTPKIGQNASGHILRHH